MSNSLQGFSEMSATFAADVDQAFWVNFWISVILGLSVLVPMFYFAWKYRASQVKDEEISEVTHHTGLEVAWTLIPTALLMVLFYFGYSSMKTLRTMPAESESIVVNLVGQKWSWQHTYQPNKNGFVHKTDELYVPQGENIIMKMTAPLGDVIHAYFVPAFRMKEDVVPGRTTQQWFKAEKLGSFDVECAEYCGTRHSYMLTKIHVIPKADFDAWFNSDNDKPDGNFTQTGEAEFKANGCQGCHATQTNDILYGPTFKTRVLTKEQVLNVIKNGQDKLGYAMGAMPAGLVSGADAEEIAAYVAGGMKGDQPASFAACSSCHGEDGKGQFGTAPSLVDYDAQLIGNVLKNGKKGSIGTMPAFPNVSDKEVAAIAEYLKNLK